MKWTLPLAALLLASCAPQAGVHSAVPATAQQAPRSFPAVTAFAQAAVRDGKVPGIAIAIGSGDQAPVIITAGKAGFAAGDTPVDADSLWRIYSMTKPITGIAAMILIDEGKLRLDQPVSDFFPEFANPTVLTAPDKGLDTRPASRAITIRDLMTHASGLNYAIVLDTPARKQLDAQGVTPFQVNKGMEAKMRPLRPATLAAFAAKAGTTPLVADPGTKWSYSMGLDVLAAVVEKASGTPFERFVQTRIFKPLGMTSTYWQVPPAQAQRLVANFGPKAVIEMFWPGTSTPVSDTLTMVDPGGAGSIYLNAPSFPYGGAGLISSARDYDRFLHMLLDDGTLDGKRILSPEAARLAKSNLLPEGVYPSGGGPFPPNEPVGFGAGGFVTLKDIDAFGRGKGSYGWDGAAGTRAWVDPVRKLRATMMINLLAAGSLGADFDKAIAADLGAAR